MREIALFGGSFDPPHVGHLLAAAYVLATEPVDELWLVPVLQHPFAKPLVASYEHRVALCERLAAELPRSRVSRAEQESGQTRTVDLLEWLQRKHPGVRWALVLGTDLTRRSRNGSSSIASSSSPGSSRLGGADTGKAGSRCRRSPLRR